MLVTHITKLKKQYLKNSLPSKRTTQHMTKPITKIKSEYQKYIYLTSASYCKQYPHNPRYQNTHLLKNNYRFGIALILMQIFVCFVYGFVIEDPSRDINLYWQENDVQDKLRNDLFMRNIAPVFVVIGTWFFVLVGFGLLFAYNKHLIFSALGFNLLIVALTLEWYFLINAFWAKCARTEGSSFQQNHSKIYLTNLELIGKVVQTGTILQEQSKRVRGTLTQALKCGLANSIAFSSILGRAGPSEAFIIALVGTIGYELNSQLVVGRIGIDYGHTYRIFLFGSIAGLITGWLLRSRHETKFDQLTKHHPNYTANRFSIWFSLLGVLIIWIFFPIFMLDPPYQHATIQQNYGIVSTAWITVLHSMAASTVTAVGVSTIIHGKVNIRDFIFGPIAGGIAAASASAYIVEPVWAILIGSVSGALQCISNYYQKSHSEQSNIVNTISFTLFGFNGILGSIWASIFRAAIVNAGNQFLAALATIGLGISFGIIVGVLVLCVTRHRRGDYFRDFTYWSRNDWSNMSIQRNRQAWFFEKNSEQEQSKLSMESKQKFAYPSQFSFNKQQKSKQQKIVRKREGNQWDWFQDHYRDDNQQRVWVQIGEQIQKINTQKQKFKENQEGIFIDLD